MHLYIFSSYFHILVLLWVLNLHFASREADAVLKYLKEQCSAKKLRVIVFCWSGVAMHHLMMTYTELKAGISLYGR